MRTLGWGNSKPVRIGSKEPCRGYTKPIDKPIDKHERVVEAALPMPLALPQNKNDDAALLKAEAEDVDEVVVPMRRLRLLPL